MTLNYTELIQGRYEIETLSPRSIDSQSVRDYAFNVLITAASKIILSSWKPSGMTVTRTAWAFGVLRR